MASEKQNGDVGVSQAATQIVAPALGIWGLYRKCIAHGNGRVRRALPAQRGRVCASLLRQLASFVCMPAGRWMLELLPHSMPPPDLLYMYCFGVVEPLHLSLPLGWPLAVDCLSSLVLSSIFLHLLSLF